MDCQESQAPHDILLNHNIALWGSHHLYGNILAIKNVLPSIPDRKGFFWPYEESARAISATMEDTRIIKDVLKLLACMGDLFAARLTRAIWVEVTTLDDNLPLSPVSSPQPFISHLSNEVPISNISSHGEQVPVDEALRAEPQSEVSSHTGSSLLLPKTPDLVETTITHIFAIS
ncbi:hypothetical protein BDN71DRAFT_1502319 [Pleurotus eryngii]|uniref:Uncharacterized protein n=1 Tax=Pleurotus eryngii TaxID=5323 RepID=A0A9P6A6N2_PLEER|nr:hypothetical protein BDN71DRAFT_1502319 [Pleurotus eryngii]